MLDLLAISSFFSFPLMETPQHDFHFDDVVLTLFAVPFSNKLYLKKYIRNKLLYIIWSALSILNINWFSFISYHFYFTFNNSYFSKLETHVWRVRINVKLIGRRGRVKRRLIIIRWRWRRGRRRGLRRRWRRRWGWGWRRWGELVRRKLIKLERRKRASFI